jgi:hypothetical protein
MSRLHARCALGSRRGSHYLNRHGVMELSRGGCSACLAEKMRATREYLCRGPIK